MSFGCESSWTDLRGCRCGSPVLDILRVDVLSLRKHNLILGYTWFKDHNLEVNWQKGKVEMIHCPLKYEGYKKQKPRQGNSRSEPSMPARADFSQVLQMKK